MAASDGDTDDNCPECGAEMELLPDDPKEGWTAWHCDNCGEKRWAEGDYTEESVASLLDIPFNEWSQTRLDKGEKHATTRTDRYGSRGDQFVVDGQLYELTHVVEVPLAVVANHFYEAEGCLSTEEFVGVWEDIHYRRGYEPGWEVWLHLFREVDDGE